MPASDAASKPALAKLYWQISCAHKYPLRVMRRVRPFAEFPLHLPPNIDDRIGGVDSHVFPGQQVPSATSRTRFRSAILLYLITCSQRCHRSGGTPNTVIVLLMWGMSERLTSQTFLYTASMRPDPTNDPRGGRRDA